MFGCMRASINTRFVSQSMHLTLLGIAHWYSCATSILKWPKTLCESSKKVICQGSLYKKKLLDIMIVEHVCTVQM